MQSTLPVPAEDDRLFAHTGNEIVSGLRDLGFVAYEQPGPGKDLFLLFGVDLFVDENLPADLAGLHVYKSVDEPALGFRSHLVSLQVSTRPFGLDAPEPGWF